MVELQPQTQTLITTNNDFSVIILLYKNPNFVGFSKPFDLALCGKKMWKWVENACSDFQIKTTLCTNEQDVLPLIKPMLTNAKHTLVLFSDTPLVSKELIEQIANFAKQNENQVVRLTRGYVFDTKFAKTATEIPKVLVEHFEDEDFTTVFDLRQLEFVNQILKNKIIEFHQKKGVCILDNQTTFIDADCVIERGVIIYPNNSILGNSFVGKNTILMSGNVIISSEIGEKVTLNGAYIENAKIENEKVINAFERICGK